MSRDEADLLIRVRQFLEQQAELGLETLPKQPPVIREAGDHFQPEPGEILESLEQKARSCEACSLCSSRSSVVFGSGNPDAGIMFVGEAPGAEEDRSGLPFVGAAGQLLTRMIEAIGMSRDDVYIANVIKCRPPQNRDPLPEEIAACEPFLCKQIARVDPIVICTLGRIAAQTLLKTTEPIARLQGKVFDYSGINLVPTYHPAALLRNAQLKRPAWEDLKLVRSLYDGTKRP